MAGFGGFRFGNIMGGGGEDEGLGGGKRFTTSTLPTFRGSYGTPEEDFQTPFNQGGQPSQSNDQYGPGRYFQEMERIRRTRGPALTAYQEALGQQPTYESTKPSWLRRLGGAAQGGLIGMTQSPVAGAQAASSFVRAPYERAVEDYNAKIKGLAASANLEREESEGRLASLKAAQTFGLDYEKYQTEKAKAAHAQRVAEIKLDLEAGRLTVAQANAEINKSRAEAEQANYESLSNYRNRQGDIGEYNAVTGRTNAVTNRNNVDSLINDRLTDNQQAQADEAGRNTRAEIANRPKAPEQQAAVDMVLRQLKGDRLFGNYITGTDTQGDPFKIVPDDGSQNYADFMRRLRSMVGSSLTQGTPFDVEEEEESNLEIIPRRY